jgi:hypothetical protein
LHKTHHDATPRIEQIILASLRAYRAGAAEMEVMESRRLDHFERRSWQGLIAYAVLQYRGLPKPSVQQVNAIRDAAR